MQDNKGYRENKKYDIALTLISVFISILDIVDLDLLIL